MFDSNNFLLLVDFKDSNSGIGYDISTPIDSLQDITNALSDNTIELPVTRFLSNKFAELVVFLYTVIKKHLLDSQLLEFAKY